MPFLGLADAAEMIRARKLSPVEYTQALLDRIGKLDGRYHAFIRLTPDLAMAAARQAEERDHGRTLEGALARHPLRA